MSENNTEDYYKKAIDILSYTAGYRGDTDKICVEVAKRDPRLFCQAVEAVEEKTKLEAEAKAKEEAL